jgi:hypothetical protein
MPRRRKYVWTLEEWEVADDRFGLAELQARAELAAPPRFVDLFEEITKSETVKEK